MEQTDTGSAVIAPTWTVTDGHAGNVRQAESLVHALGCANVEAMTLQPRAPWRWLTPRRLPGVGHAFGDAFESTSLHPPALAIGCGRQAALATRLLRERGSRVVQILDPRLDPRHWDRIIVPVHDGLRGENVLTVIGSLNPIDDAWLDAARTQFPALGTLPGPRTAVLIGGSSVHAAFEREDFLALAARLDDLIERDGGSLMITASRRTSENVRLALRRRYAGSARVLWIDATDGTNPYAGMLAWADRIVCTGDSVNMVSEACATRVPVRVHGLHQVQGRPRRFLESLVASGRLLALDEDDGFLSFTGEPLRETARVAALLHPWLAEQGLA